MGSLAALLENNRAWAESQTRRDAGFFKRLVARQRPEYLWIGCSDSRVPASEIVGLCPGELLVHRNIGNQVIHTDMNALSVLEYAVEYLQVKHIIVCGHYGCGGVCWAIEETRHGLADHWLQSIRDVYEREREELGRIGDGTERLNRLCELNVKEQVRHVAETTIVRDAWRRGQPVVVHGWIYDLADGLLRDLGVSCQGCEQEGEGIV